jgi:hypothetical protein
MSLVIWECSPINAGELVMAKGQKRSNREAKKPKKPASDKKAASPSVAGVIERPSAKGGKRP